MSANVDWLSLPAELSAAIWRLHPKEQARLSHRRRALRQAKRVEKVRTHTPNAAPACMLLAHVGTQEVQFL